ACETFHRYLPNFKNKRMKLKSVWPRIGCFLMLTIAALTLPGCEQDDQHAHVAGKKSPTISRKTFDELMQTEKFRLAIQKLPKTKNASAANARTIMEDQYGFTIVDVPAKIIESDSAISYTLLVRPDSISADFENLVINYNKS